MAGEACTTVPKLGERNSHSSQERSCSWEDWNRVAGHYLSDSVLLLGLDFHGHGHGHGRQHRVCSSHAELWDRLVVGRWEVVEVEVGKKSPGSSWLPS